MPVYKFQVMERNGHEKKGRIEAVSKAAAKEYLEGPAGNFAVSSLTRAHDQESPADYVVSTQKKTTESAPKVKKKKVKKKTDKPRWKFW